MPNIAEHSRLPIGRIRRGSAETPIGRVRQGSAEPPPSAECAKHPPSPPRPGAPRIGRAPLGPMRLKIIMPSPLGRVRQRSIEPIGRVRQGSADPHPLSAECAMDSPSPLRPSAPRIRRASSAQRVKDNYAEPPSVECAKDPPNPLIGRVRHRQQAPATPSRPRPPETARHCHPPHTHTPTRHTNSETPLYIAWLATSAHTNNTDARAR